MGIQIYDQISIARKLLKVKLHRVFSLEFSLKRVQIAQNIAKIGVHACISNRHPNLWSNFNYEKLVRSETPSCIFARVGLEGVQMARTIAKVGMHIFISNSHPNLWSNFNYESLVKSETLSFDFAKAWLKGGENGFEKLETNATYVLVSPSLSKVQNSSQFPESWYAWLSLKWVPKFSFKFQLQESRKITSLRPLLDQPWINGLKLTS